MGYSCMDARVKNLKSKYNESSLVRKVWKYVEVYWNVARELSGCFLILSPSMRITFRLVLFFLNFWKYLFVFPLELFRDLSNNEVENLPQDVFSNLTNLPNL